jgi:hypothetical protein
VEAIVLNTNFEAVGIIDVYRSFIWTDRYNECGDFEISLGIRDYTECIQKDYYLINPDSDHAMIIESISIETDTEEGAMILVKGQSLESLLKRRIVWTKTSFEYTTGTDNVITKPNLQNGIKKLIDDAIINPSMAIRKIDNFIFEESTDPKITELTFEAQYFGEDLYEVITKLCQENDIGFAITFNENYQFVFKLYAGVDRSYGTEDSPQDTNPYVIFSPRFDNVLNTNYLDSNESFKNVTLVGGESETDTSGREISRDTTVVSLAGFHSGITRREIFTNASGVNRNIGSDDALSEDQYQAHLRKAGIDTLIEHTVVTAFEGEVDPTMMYEYGKDYFIGDIVQIENEYGHEGRAYISEYVMSCDEQGTSAYPTFTTIQKGVYETE